MIVDLEKQRIKAKDMVTQLSDEIASMNSGYLQVMTQHNGLRVKLDSELRHLHQYDAELKTLEAKKKTLEESIESLLLNKKQTEDSLADDERELGQLESKILALFRAESWIRDFERYNMAS